MSCAIPPETTTDTLLGGRIVLTQPRRGHRAGTDAILLSAAAPAGHARYADFGAGVGTVGLAISTREPAAEVTLVEIDPYLAMLAAENVRSNGLSERCRVLTADLLRDHRGRRAGGLEPGSVTCVVTNPPFRNAGAGTRSTLADRARHMPDEDMHRWVAAAADLLAPGGTLVVIHRADAVGLLLCAAKPRFGRVRLRFIHPREGENATRVLLDAVKGRRTAAAILPALTLHKADGSFTAEAAALHRGEALLPFD